MGDLGNLVGSALSYPTVGDALYSPLLSLIIHPLSLRDLSSAPDKQDPGEETCHGNKATLSGGIYFFVCFLGCFFWGGGCLFEFLYLTI